MSENIQKNELRRRVLIVDDDPSLLLLTTRILEDGGYEVETSNEVWISHLLRQFQPHLVLFDVNMGMELTGTDAVKALGDSSFGQNTHYVLYSCLHEAELRRLVNECGADDYLPKGLETEEMLRRVGGFVEVALAGEPRRELATLAHQ